MQVCARELSMCLCGCVHAWMCMNVDVCVCVDVCMCILYTYVYLGVCMSTCMCMYKCVWVGIYIVSIWLDGTVFRTCLVRSGPVTGDSDPTRIRVRRGADTLTIWRLTDRMIRRSIPAHAVKSRRRFGFKTASFHVSICSCIIFLIYHCLYYYMFLYHFMWLSEIF